MKKLNLLLLLAIGIIFGACGTTVQENKTYDMWEYMTPQHSIDVEYSEYKNGQKIDYFNETTKVFRDSVERGSGDYKTVLIPYQSHIRIEESKGEKVEVVTVQRYVKIGDSDIFDSSNNQKCKAEDYFHSIRIKGYEFFNVIKVACVYSDSSTADFYYGYDEGIVTIDKNNKDERTEIVKVRETQLR